MHQPPLSVEFSGKIAGVGAHFSEVKPCRTLTISKWGYNAAAAAATVAKSLQSSPTLCDSLDGSPPGSPVLGILQARTLEWVAISFSNA